MRRQLFLTGLASMGLLVFWLGCGDDKKAGDDDDGAAGGTPTATVTSTSTSTSTTTATATATSTTTNTGTGTGTVTSTGSNTGTGTVTSTGSNTGTGTGSQTDYLEVTVDGTQVYYIDITTANCGNSTHELITVDISSYADGSAHSVAVHAETFAALGGTTNFIVDNITTCNPSGGTGGGTPCSNAVTDGSFEGGAGGGSWTEASTNFGTPLCDISSCGDGGGSVGPQDGSWWAWFGGIGAYEEGSVTQSVTIPSGANSLYFYLAVPACDDGSS